MKIGFIGAGSMGSAMIKGLLKGLACRLLIAGTRNKSTNATRHKRRFMHFSKNVRLFLLRQEQRSCYLSFRN